MLLHQDFIFFFNWFVDQIYAGESVHPVLHSEEENNSPNRLPSKMFQWQMALGDFSSIWANKMLQLVLTTHAVLISKHTSHDSTHL